MWEGYKVQNLQSRGSASLEEQPETWAPDETSADKSRTNWSSLYRLKTLANMILETSLDCVVFKMTGRRHQDYSEDAIDISKKHYPFSAFKEVKHKRTSPY